MPTSQRPWLRRFWGIPPLLIGLALVLLAPKVQSGPQPANPEERATKVRVLAVRPVPIQPRLVGYGTVQASRTWEAVAEVAGPVVWLADTAQSGETVSAGTELIRIGESDYQLALAQIDAQLKASTIRNRTSEASLALAEKDLALLTADYERKKDLAAKGAGAQNAVDAAERLTLNGQSQVQSLRNAIDLNQAERGVLEAQRQAALLNLERTHLKAPFDLRITDVRVSEMQYANRGQLLLTADALDAVEVEARFPVGALRPLITLTNQDSTAQGVLSLQATVRLRTPTHSVTWPAQIDRVSGVIDPQTQALGVVVRIDDPLSQARPGKRPPLLRNTFVEVELSAQSAEAQLILPRSAVHGGQVYVVTAENRLELRPVQVRFTHENYAVLQKGVTAGEQVVVSDLLTPVPGMLLAPQEDPKAQRALMTQATGQVPPSTGKGGSK